MKRVGECVGRELDGSSPPRAASEPPITFTPGAAAFNASYVSVSSARYAVAATSDPPGPNCGIQNRLRFGSLPTMRSRTAGSSRTTEAA